MLKTAALVLFALCTASPAAFAQELTSGWSLALPDAPISMLQAAGGGDATHSLSDPKASNSNELTIFKHPDETPWFFAGQINIIFQAHPGFHSPYQGPNSFLNGGEYKTSLLGTVYTGYQLDRLFGGWGDRYHLDGIFDGEEAGGRGLSNALGIAGYPNLDVVRNPYLSVAPYIGRGELHATIGFTDEMTDVDRGPLSFATRVSVRRLELRVGKMSMADVFDLNDILSDSHLQFTNWAVDNNGAWDYAADTRGYTYALTGDYEDRIWGVRYGLALMPTVANGIDLDWAISRAKGQNWEAELRKGFLPGRKGTQRVLVYRNNAHMGSYREAVQAYLAGTDPTPTITLHEHFGAVKYGFGYNFEQWISQHFHIGGRFGWNEGQHETWAYTEIDQTALIGAEYEGARWHRPTDQFGIAFVSNAIKRDHQNYLAYGGLGFLLGDGRLNYGRENIEEAYYNLHARSGLYFALGLNHVDNPGYNRDRGPVWVPAVRAHVDF